MTLQEALLRIVEDLHQPGSQQDNAQLWGLAWGYTYEADLGRHEYGGLPTYQLLQVNFRCPVTYIPLFQANLEVRRNEFGSGAGQCPFVGVRGWADGWVGRYIGTSIRTPVHTPVCVQKIDLISTKL